MKRLAILGSTGSIGRSTLDVVRAARDRFTVVALAAQRNWEKLEAQAREFGVTRVALADEGAAAALKARQPGWDVLAGEAGLLELAGTEASLVVAAMVGAAGARPVLAALERGTDIGLANKEALVMGGDLVTAAAKAGRARLLPIDSEHNALFQCLAGERPETVARLILTASGGPFFTRTDPFDTITPKEALAHPRWAMGEKVTIDSATLMNKGLEVIEARHLFGLGPERISVVVHPQSIVHSLVEFHDGSIKAQLGATDMRLPIAHVLNYPERPANALPKLKLVDLEPLTFARADTARFPALALAYDAIKAGGTAPAILNAANEVAVSAFIRGALSFPGIAATVADALATVAAGPARDWETVLDADRRARESAAAFILKK